jgi:glycogen synthase
MKVLMYGWEFPPMLSGGLGVACHAIVQELARKKHDVTIVLPYMIENNIDQQHVVVIGCDALAAKIEKIVGFKYGGQFDFSKFATNLSPYLNTTDPAYLTKLDQASQAVAQIIAKLRALNEFSSIADLSVLHHERDTHPAKITGNYTINLLAEVCHYAIIAGALGGSVPHDVIHAHDWLTVLAGIEAKRRSGKPLVFHVHALEPDRSGAYVDTRIFAIEKYGMEQADVIIAVSAYTKRMIVEKYGIDPNKIVVVHNGTYNGDIVAREWSPQKRNKMVLFLGRLAHQKGPFSFVDAAQKILAHRHDVHFVIAGDGGLWREMIERVAALRLGRYIHFTGFLDHQKISRIFGLADVYVMPSVSEPFGLSCLEALSYGVPVVISKQSGAAEVLPNVVKVDFWDVNDMADKILALLDRPVLRRITLRKSMAKLKTLTWERTANAIVNVYQKMLLRRGRSDSNKIRY